MSDHLIGMRSISSSSLLLLLTVTSSPPPQPPPPLPLLVFSITVIVMHWARPLRGPKMAVIRVIEDL